MSIYVPKVLIACEESQTACIEFRKLGIDAYSCDLQECSGGYPEWHIRDDVLKIINGHCSFKTQAYTYHWVDKWDMVIAHPPCTYLSRAGSTSLYPKGKLNQERYEKGLQGKEFFMKFLKCDCDKICVENPVPSAIYELPKASQVIEPYFFGDPYRKHTFLWLKNLPPLMSTNIVVPNSSWVGTHSGSKSRSKSFKGIAAAMANQWSIYLF